MHTLTEIFTAYSSDVVPVTETEEAALIADAKAGDDEATLRLLTLYGPALRSAVGRFKGNVRDGQTSVYADDFGTASHSIEDLRSTAVVAFLDVIAEHDPERSPRLAGAVSQRLTRALADEVTATSAFVIPERTLSRFFGILRNADGDVETALDSAPTYGMSRETFRDVLAAVQASSLDDVVEAATAQQERIEGARPIYSTTPIADAEDRILVEAAFSAVDDDEARICELAYGFRGTEDYAPGEAVPDEAIAAVVGFSRPTVQRKRGKALGKMRKALGVALDA